MKTTLPILEYTSLSDKGRVRLANEDATFCDDRMGLFVVCDGLGGRPSGEAASHIIAQSLRHLIRRKLRQLTEINGNIVKNLLQEVAQELNEELNSMSQGIEPLVGMGATLALLLIDGATAYVLHVGDSRVYLMRDGKMQQVTNDHFRMGVPAPSMYRNGREKFASNRNGDGNGVSATGQEQDKVERRLLTQFIGISRPLEPDVSVFALKPNDRFLLCSDGLTDPVEEQTIASILGLDAPLSSICQTLTNAANQAGGPDNITTVVVNYRGTKQIEVEALKKYGKIRVMDPPKGIAIAFHKCLLALQGDLKWLIDGSTEASGENTLKAFSAVKHRLGPDLYHLFMKLHPSKNPSHVYHRAASAKEGEWRQRYETHHLDLAKHLNTITASNVRLSPIMTPDETALILTTLWRDWRRVEKRYFKICEEANFVDTGKMLDYLLDLMSNSVNTLIGMMGFLPRFMRRVSVAAS